MPAITLPTQHRGTVTAAATISPKIRHLQVTPDSPIHYHAGQYASFLIDSYRRPLSYATPDDYPELEFVVDVSPNGVASKFVVQLEAGDLITFLSPYGRFTLDEAWSGPQLFIAAGPPLTLIFGNRDEEHCFWLEEFVKLAEQHARFTFIPVCTQASDTWSGERGLVTEVAVRRIEELPRQAVYVCGGPAMVRSTVAMLQSHSVPQAQIHTEQFIGGQ